MSKKKKCIKCLVAVFVVLALLFAAGITFPTFWGPRLVEKAVLAILPHGEGAENKLKIEKVGLVEVKVRDVRLGGLPTAPSCESASVRYSLAGLRKRHVDAVEAKGLCLVPAYRVANFALPSLGGAGVKTVPDDPLQGWSIGSVVAETAGIDFSSLIPPEARKLLGGSKVGMSLKIAQAGGEYIGEARGMAFGAPIKGKISYSPGKARGKVELDYPLEEGNGRFPQEVRDLGVLTLDAAFKFTGTNGIECAVTGDAGFSRCDWKVGLSLLTGGAGAKFRAELPNVALSETEPLVKAGLVVVPLPPNIGDLHFSGTVTGDVCVVVGEGQPEWSVRAEAKDISGGLTASGIPIEAAGGRTRVSIDGIGKLWNLKPVPVAITNASFGVISFEAGHAILSADERTLVINEGDIGFCGGHVRLYALYLDLKKLNTGFTVVLDDLQAGKFIQQFPQLEGSTATGALYGKLPLRIKGDGTLRLSDGFLYSPPGETGTISIANPEVVTDILAETGVPEPVCQNLGKALRNLDYEKLRLDLIQPREVDGRIAIQLSGKSKDGKVVTPVNLNISVNGQIERVLNLAIKTAKLKDLQF